MESQSVSQVEIPLSPATNQSVITKRMATASIAIAFVIVALFILTTMFNSMTQKAVTDRFNLVENANRFVDGSKTLTNEVRAFAATGNMSHYDNYWKEINEDKNREIGVENMKAIGITDTEEDFINKMSDLSNKLVPLEENAMEKAMNGDYNGAIEYVYGDDYSNTLEEIYGIRDSFYNSLNTRLTNRISTINKIRIANTILMGIIIIALIIVQVMNTRFIRNELIVPIIKIKEEMHLLADGILSSSFDLIEDSSEVGQLVHSIHKCKSTLKTYIGDISDKLSSLAAGNMNLEITQDYIGEFKPIQLSMVRIVDYLNATILSIKNSTEEVSNRVLQGADSVSGDAHKMADSARDQSAAIQNLVNSVAILATEMDDMVKDVSSANTATENITIKLEQNMQQMKDMEEAIHHVSDASEGIRNIMEEVKQIASQTNLLSLNASIEAARAGDAGKGFAVVADEVRALSESSKEASERTKELIEDSLSAVERGVSLTDKTFREMQIMSRNIQETAEKVSSISQSAEKKVSELHEIKESFLELSASVDENAILASDSANAADDLNNQARQLETLFADINLKEE